MQGGTIDLTVMKYPNAEDTSMTSSSYKDLVNRFHSDILNPWRLS